MHQPNLVSIVITDPPTQRHIPDRNDHSSPYQLDAVEGALAEAEAQKTKLHRVGIEVLAHLIDTP